jgi:uncharacterized membrane protein
MKSKTQKLVFAALIAAIYAALTVVLAPISYGAVQVRISEALTILPFFSSFSIMGLFVGCLISNFFSPVGVIDIIFGSSATLIAAIITYFIGRSNIKFKKYIAPLPAVLTNAVIIGILLNLVPAKGNMASFIPNYTLNTTGLFVTMLWVGIGEFIACYVIGLPLLMLIERNKKIKEYLS